MFDKFKTYFRIVRDKKKQNDLIGNEDYIISEIMRRTHSIEKGMCIPNPRPCFGFKKIKELFDLINQLGESKKAVFAKENALCAIISYLDYHHSLSIVDSRLTEIENEVKRYRTGLSKKDFGGVVELSKKELRFDIDSIEKFFNSRHSVRSFSDEDVEDSKILKALILAQKCPSACNRQAYRVYILSKEKSRLYSKTLEGIGGFENSTSRFLLVTSVQSAYRENEVNEHIVSASIFAGYLTLTLHLYGIESCVIRRDLIWQRNQRREAKKFGINEEEQLICVLGIGYPKDKFLVPRSQRFEPAEVFKFVN